MKYPEELFEHAGTLLYVSVLGKNKQEEAVYFKTACWFLREAILRSMDYEEKSEYWGE